MTVYDLAIKLYLPPANDDTDKTKPPLLRLEKVEAVILSQAMEAYDGASNGNKHRGGVKKANEM